MRRSKLTIWHILTLEIVGVAYWDESAGNLECMIEQLKAETWSEKE